MAGSSIAGIKCILGFLGTVTAFALVYIVRLCNVLSAYGTHGLNAPAASMEHLWRISQNISVGQYILIIMLMRFIGGLLVSLFVFAMFKYLRSGMSVIISCVLFIVLPLALVAFGVTNAQYMLFNPVARKYILKYILNSIRKTLQIVPMKDEVICPKKTG